MVQPNENKGNKYKTRDEKGNRRKTSERGINSILTL
jgi:hypothetical protein